jgi:hypothetical protein
MENSKIVELLHQVIERLDKLIGANSLLSIARKREESLENYRRSSMNHTGFDVCGTRGDPAYGEDEID